MEIQQGQFVEVRGRPWLVEAVDDTQPGMQATVLSPRGRLTCGTPLVGLEAAEIDTDRNLARFVVGPDNQIGLDT